MKYTLGCCLLCSLCLASVSLPVAWSADPPAKKAAKEAKADTAETTALRANSQAFVAAFNKHDAKALAAQFTAGGEYIDDAGRHFNGRDEIGKGYAGFFTENPKAQIRVLVDSVRLLSDSAALEEGRATVEPAPAGSPGVSKYTAVHVKVDGKWLTASVRDTWVDTASAYANVADLEWLIGTWKAEENGAQSESVCRWVANKSFVERSYTTTLANGAVTTGVQLIGWNPQLRRVQSWNFSSDGGHAVGVWTPRDGGWTAEIVGVTGEGLPTTSVNTLTRLDDNAYAWQATQRTLSGSALPDLEEVVVKRQPAR